MSLRHRVSVIVLHQNKILGFNAEDPFNGKKYVFLPGGLIEKNESIEEAAIRETLEETGYQIQIPRQTAITRRYFFDWNGKSHDCKTEYLQGGLTSNQAKLVQDADYHRGVIWIPVKEIPLVFSYHKDILQPILDTLGSKREWPT